MADRWDALADAVGLEAAQQFYDHVAQTPGEIPLINGSTVLKGKAGRPVAEGFSRTIHYEISSSGRINYQWNAAFTGGRDGDPHGVVYIRTIDLGSH